MKVAAVLRTESRWRQFEIKEKRGWQHLGFGNRALVAAVLREERDEEEAARV